MENKARIEAESNHPSRVGLDICVKLHDLSGLRTVQVTRCWNAHRQIILDLIFVDQRVKDAHQLVVLRNAMSVWWIYVSRGRFWAEGIPITKSLIPIPYIHIYPSGLMRNIWMLHPVGKGVTGVFLLLLLALLLQDRFPQCIPKPGAEGLYVHHDVPTLLPLLQRPTSIANQRTLQPVLTCWKPLFEQLANDLSILVVEATVFKMQFFWDKHKNSCVLLLWATKTVPSIRSWYM